ncbi:hypothetical protein CRE_02527 [Caenorhabditis remanei]|uniref:Uncharacterized protein n=1 Tax=Caenorhabditis remanei TaxID=31234 RepID=E3MWR3_CAERE|nr:hypothetical protein CRE_02527 [Caenorhabditis remanei]
MAPRDFDPIPVPYQKIRGVPFYMNFEYKLNWVTPMTITDLLLNIIGTLIFIQIPIFYFKNKQKIKNIGLRLDVFQSFLLMQTWSIWMLIGEFLMFKIPFTGMITNYCANNNPQILLRFTVFFFYWAHYSSQLFTLLFCALRVAILYSNSNEEKKKLFYYLIPPFIFFSFSRKCTSFELCAFASFVFTAAVTFTIIGLNIAMFFKIRKRKMSSLGQSQSTQNKKASRTLTGTMIIMLTPLIVYLFVLALEVIPSDYFVHILYIGDIVGDIRVHTVSCYFYFTHPVFKKHGMIRKITVTQKVTSQSRHF